MATLPFDEFLDNDFAPLYDIESWRDQAIRYQAAYKQKCKLHESLLCAQLEGVHEITIRTQSTTITVGCDSDTGHLAVGSLLEEIRGQLNFIEGQLLKTLQALPQEAPTEEELRYKKLLLAPIALNTLPVAPLVDNERGPSIRDSAPCHVAEAV